MIRNGWYVILLASALALGACEKEAEPEGDEGAEETVSGIVEGAEETVSGIVEGAEETVSGIVEVAVDGSEFDPPVQLAQIPPGSWICDMGTVHYASQQEGDGACPICGMHLTQTATDNPEPAPTTEAEPPATAPTEAEPPAAAPTTAPTTAPTGP